MDKFVYKKKTEIIHWKKRKTLVIFQKRVGVKAKHAAVRGVNDTLIWIPLNFVARHTLLHL